MYDMNLLDGFATKGKDERKKSHIFLIVFPFVLLVAGTVAALLYFSEYEKKYDTAQIEVQEQASMMQEVTIAKNLLAESEIRLGTYDMVEEYVETLEIDNVDNLELLAGNMPDNIYSISLMYSENKICTVAGMSKDMNNIAYLISLYKENDKIDNVKLSGATAIKDGEEIAEYAFQINVKLK